MHRGRVYYCFPRRDLTFWRSDYHSMPNWSTYSTDNLVISTDPTRLRDHLVLEAAEIQPSGREIIWAQMYTTEEDEIAIILEWSIVAGVTSDPGKVKLTLWSQATGFQIIVEAPTAQAASWFGGTWSWTLNWINGTVVQWDEDWTPRPARWSMQLDSSPYTVRSP